MADIKVPGYNVINKIRDGGTASVYHAEKYTTGVKVAVKVLLPKHMGDKGVRKQFKREAELGKKLKHDNVIKIMSYHEENATRPTIVMELFESDPLKYLIKSNGQFPLPQAVSLILQAARALNHLHKKEIIHKDIKPENFLMNKKGVVKLIDLSLGETLAEIKRKKLISWLIKGKIQGTPTYIAPEQIQRKTLSPQTDIYSFGASCYEILTGNAPFSANRPQALLKKHLTEKPSSMRSDVEKMPMDLDECILSMLQKKPENRPENLDNLISICEKLYKKFKVQQKRKKKSKKEA